MFRTIQIDERLVKMLKHNKIKQTEIKLQKIVPFWYGSLWRPRYTSLDRFYYFPTKKSSTQMAHYMPFGSAHFFIISSALRLASKETTIQYLNQLLQNQSH